MFDDAADVIQRDFGQACIAVAAEQILAAFPQRLMHVHARAVVADNGLRHEGRGLAVGMGNVVHGVLEDLVPVSAFHQAGEHGADFALPRRCHFMMMHFNRHALLFESQAHRRTDILQRIHRRNGEVAALDRRTMAHVAAIHVITGGPRRFRSLHAGRRAGHVDVPGHRIKNEKLGFRTEIGGVADAGRFQVRLAAFGDRARIAVVTLAIVGFNHVAGHDQGRFVGERVHARTVRIRHQQHVGGLNALPAGNGRTVKRMAVGELVVAEHLGRHRHVLFFTQGVGKTEVNELDFVVLEHLHDIGSASHLTLLTIAND